MWAFLFPGQGSQFVGMGHEIAQAFPEAKEVFQQASDSLSYDMEKLCFKGIEDRLHLTEYTQPALLTTSIAFFQVLKDIIPISHSQTVVAGHSVGEYSAHVSAGTFDFLTAVKAVKQRGRFMQEAVRPGKGGMVACIGLSEKEISSLLSWCHKELSKSIVLEPAAYNTSSQTVLSGHQEAISFLQTTSVPEELGFKKSPYFIPLKVSAPFHCSLMLPAQEKMAPIIDQMDFSLPQCDVVPNTSAQKTSEVAILKQALKEQITAPVKWVQTIKHLRSLGFQNFIEVGSGKVLSGLLRQIDRNAKSFRIESPKDFDKISDTIN